MRLLLVAILLGAVAAIFPITGVVAAVNETGVGIRLLEAPSDRRDDPRAQSYIVDHLPPGTTITRKLEVANGTSRPAKIAVYAGGAELNDGAFQPLEEPGTNELTTWTKVEPASMDLAPGQKAPATVTITVPADASPGERYGAVWAALSSDPDAGGVTQVNRVGIRIYLSVGPGGEPASDFSVTSLTAKRNPDGTPVVTAEVRNTGGRALDLGGELNLTDGPGGLSGGPFSAELGTTLGVDEVAPVTILLDKELPNGPWQANLTLKSGILERSATAEITFPEEGSGPAVPVDSGNSGRTVPLVAGTLGLLLLGVLSFVMIRRSKGRSLRAIEPK
jgi:hypothetical protein